MHTTIKQTALNIAITTVLGLMAAQGAQAAVTGDLSIFTPGDTGTGSTILMMLESTTNMNACGVPGQWAADVSNCREGGWGEDGKYISLQNVQSAPVSGSNFTPTYKRYYVIVNGKQYFRRATLVKDAMFALLDSPALDPTLKLGMGMFAGSTMTGAPTGDSTTGAILVPALPVGGVNSDQRNALKAAVLNVCSDDATGLCTGLSPGARAYAEAGAYMMGTKTMQLFSSGTGVSTTLLPRTLRGNNPQSSLLEKTWQYCPPEKRVLVDYIYSSYRLTCMDNDWITIDKNNASQYGFVWNCGLLNCTGPTNRPQGIDGKYTQGNQSWQYIYDAILNPYDGWNYYYDALNPVDVPRPPTGDVEYLGSGMRNSPPSVRGPLSYTYKNPDYGICDGKQETVDSITNTRQPAGGSSTIFYMTGDGKVDSDGFNNSTFTTANLMNMSLSPANSTGRNPVGGALVCDPLAPITESGLIAGSGWNCIAQYAKRLNPVGDPTLSNPLGRRIRTAIYQFVKPENVITSQKKLGIGTVLNCATARTSGISNMCNWGTPAGVFTGVGGFGEGGYIQQAQDNTFTSQTDATRYQPLIDALNGTIKTATPAGLIFSGSPIIPANPLVPDQVYPEAYLPMVAPQSGSTAALWQGNLRKYNVTNGRLVDPGNSDNSVFDANGNLETTTRDLWTSTAAGASDTAAAQSGGAYSQIPYATSTTPAARKVFLSNGTNGPGALTALPTDLAGMQGATFSVGSIPEDTLKTKLLNFLGFKISSNGGLFVSAGKTATVAADLVPDGGATLRSLGGVVHSSPVLATYSATLDTTGNPTSPVNSVLYGSMDGALHLVDSATGVEQFAFIPREVLTTNSQYKALTKGDTAPPSPGFGVDGPWSIYSTYTVAADNSKITANKVYAFGGLRLGGTSYYGLNITTPTAPTQLFRIGSDVTNFGRMSYTWAKPLITKIKWKGVNTLVMIVPGGYDTTYDDTDATRLIKNASAQTTETAGNALYIVAAETTKDASGNVVATAGDRLVTAGLSTAEGASAGAINTAMKYSIVAAPKLLDRDADGLTDNIYFADLGGQVFRLDLDNTATTTTAPSPAVRVVRIADFTTANTGTNPGPRFYETPVVTIDDNAGQRFAAVSVASGDRSNPLDTQGVSKSGYAAETDKVFVVIDKDVARRDLYAATTSSLNTQNVTLSQLVNTPTTATTNDVNKMLSTGPAGNGRTDGWYRPLDHFEANTSGVPNLKAMGPLSALNSKLYVGVYNPTGGGTTTSCAAQVNGTTEAQEFCLPFGVCAAETGVSTTNNIRRYFIGRGIQPITYGPSSSSQTGRSIISTTMGGITKELESGATISKSASPSYDFNYQLKPTRWFELLKGQ